MHKAFQYTSSDDLDSLPFAGLFTTYGGGGYVFDFLGSISQIKTNLEHLRNSTWIDRRTRNILIEFNLYNPNVNLFAVCTFAFELLPTGNFITISTVEIINLFGQQSAVQNGIYFAYVGLVFWSVFREGKKIYRLKKAYFFQLWSWVQWTIIITSIAAFAIWTYRSYFGQKLLESFAQNKGKHSKLTRIHYSYRVFPKNFYLKIYLNILRILKI